jgi:integrase
MGLLPKRQRPENPASKCLFIQSPTPKSGRRTFGLIERQVDQNGKAFNYALHSNALSGINKQFLEGHLSYDDARKLVVELKNQLRPRIANNYLSSNLTLLKQYWRSEYEDKDIVAPEAAYNRLLRGISAVGQHSLYLATREVLQKEIDSKFNGNKQRSRVAALNQILKFINRGIKLRRKREEIRTLTYLTVPEFESFICQVRGEFNQLLFRAAFASGLRTGELFGILPSDIFGDHLRISSQIDVRGVRRHTKTRRPRDAFILPGWESHVQRWAAIPLKERLPHRKNSYSKVARSAARKAFPDQLEKQCVTHSLRHSYAVYMISVLGVPLGLVSKSLGNSTHVAEKYYIGYSLNAEAIDHIRMIIKKNGNLTSVRQIDDELRVSQSLS